MFLFDEFFIPRRIAAATVQGLRRQKANEGDLASMKTLNSKAKGVDLIDEGHRLRWTKQLALRGRGRTYDQHGLCGKQRLVVSSDLESFMSNATKLFPGANIRTAGVYAKSTRASLLIEILSDPELPPKLTTKEVSRLMETKTGKRTPWRVVSSNVLTEEFGRALVRPSWIRPVVRNRFPCGQVWSTKRRLRRISRWSTSRSARMGPSVGRTSHSTRSATFTFVRLARFSRRLAR